MKSFAQLLATTMLNISCFKIYCTIFESLKSAKGHFLKSPIPNSQEKIGGPNFQAIGPNEPPNPLSLHFSTSIWPKPTREVHWGIGVNVVWRAKERVPLCTLGFEGKFATIVEP